MYCGATTRVLAASKPLRIRPPPEPPPGFVTSTGPAARHRKSRNTTAAQTAIIGALAPVVPTLPTGSRARINTEADLRRATQRHENLTASQQLRGPVAAPNRALGLRQVQVQITEINTFVAEATARKAEL